MGGGDSAGCKVAEGFRDDPRSVPTSRQERAALASGNSDAYWNSREKRGDALGQEGVEFSLNRKGPREVEAAKAGLMDALLLKHGARAMPGVGVVVGGNRADAVREYNQIRLQLAIAHMTSVDRDMSGVPHMLSAHQIATYHWRVFGNHGLPATTFGGSKLTGTSFDLWLYAGLWCGACDR
jgi:hypothetical protein